MSKAIFNTLHHLQRGWVRSLLLLAWMHVLPTNAQLQGVSLELGPGVSLELVAVPAGSFEQGSAETEADRSPDESRRTVTLSRGFLIGRFPVTRAQFERFALESGYRTEAEKGPSGGFGWDGTALRQSKSYTWRTPGFPQEANHPVTMVTHADALAFCRWLKSKTGREFNLPTEAQWEYACRAGTTTAWHHGEQADQATEFVWSKPTAENHTHPVASRKANPWGIHIGGNVAEWCLDWYGPYPAGPATDPIQTNPNLSDKPRRVLRGGSWLREIQHTRSAARYRNDPGSRNADNGFRVVTFQLQAPAASTSRAPSSTGTSPSSEPTQAAPPASEPSPQPKPPSAEPRSFVPPPASPHPPTAAPPRTFLRLAWVLGGLVIVGSPILALIAFFIRRVSAPSSVQRLSSMSSKRTGRAGPLSAPTPVDDGFWFTSDPTFEGTRFLYSYWLHDQLQQGHVMYQPGPDGQQFVYTGSRPERITLQAQPDEAPEAPPPVLPRYRDNDDSSPTDRLLASGPFPPAY